MHGVDISSHQNPTAINWEALAKTHRFVICRATYGTRTDSQFAAHVAAARRVGLKVGAYHFYRQTQPIELQLAAFAGATDGKILDLVPALDLESNDSFDGPADPALYANAKPMADAWRTQFGNYLLYTTASFWRQMGSPAW